MGPGTNQLKLGIIFANYPTKHFATYELQIPSFGEIYVVQKRRFADFGALKS